MTNITLSRRDFLKMSGAATSALAATQLMPPPVARAARPLIDDPNGDGYIPTMCEMCVWRCGVLA